jgi:hypothetical protein
LLAKWLQRVKSDFTFATITSTVSNIDSSHFTRVERGFVASFDSNILLDSLLDRSQAPENYAAILDFWDRLQANKDEQSANHLVRNTLPQDDLEYDDDINQALENF